MNWNEEKLQQNRKLTSAQINLKYKKKTVYIDGGW